MNRILFYEQPEEEVFCKGIIDHPHGVPSWLRGIYLKNGPGVFTMPRGQYNHFFDGPAKIQKFSIFSENELKIAYHSKFIQTKSRKKALEWGAPYYMEFGTSSYAGVGLWNRFLAFFDQVAGITDNLNIAFLHYKNQIFVTGETPFIYQMDLDSMDIIKKNNLMRKLHLTHTIPHPVIDPNENVCYSLGISYRKFHASNIIYRIDVNCQDNIAPKKPLTHSDGSSKKATEDKSHSKGLIVEKIAEIPCREGKFNYNHSIAVTRNYVIYLEQPLDLSISSMFATKFTESEGFQKAFSMTDKNTNFIVVSKSTGKVVNKVEANLCFYTMHHVNSYEKNVPGGNVDDVCIVLHCISYTSFDMFTDFKKESPDYGKLMEFIIAVPNGKPILSDDNTCAKIEGRVISELAVDIPSINKDYFALPYKYAWFTMQAADKSSELICKVNVMTGDHVYWSQSGLFAAEPVFVGRPKSSVEDDGIILSTGHSGMDPKDCFLGIYDAATMVIQARVTFPGVTVLHGMHGLFVPQKEDEEEK